MAHNHVKREARHATDSGAKALEHLSEEARQAVQAVARQVRDETLELVEAGRQQMAELSESAESAIRSNPARSVVVALGIGCVIGILLARR